MTKPSPAANPFAHFLGPAEPRLPLRQAIDRLHRAPETECVPPLIAAATVSPSEAAAIRALGLNLVQALRAAPGRSPVEGLMREYALSSQEGVALMCLAEALLRTPDRATRDALIADKIAPGDWQAHIGHGRSLFVNAATWGLVVTGRLVTPIDDKGLGRALSRVITRSGEPVIRAGVRLAMTLLGEQFVAGQTIAEALDNAVEAERAGFRHSYDMLGEAATTAADAVRYLEAYRTAITAIGKAAAGRGIVAGPGISIKLSALHPRYARSQRDRVMDELLPRVRELAHLARAHEIGLNIDAEEQDRLDLSLDILEALCADPDLVGWHGIGFVVQAYARRSPAVIDFLVDLAARTGHRLMIRLVKGAYWDSEIKRAQVDGLADFPVFTRKVHTDLAYIACARKLLAARKIVFPQFATHNAQTLATIHTLAGPDFAPGDYEFQCLHGMGEPLYEQVVGPKKLDRPCRIYAPVGSHETLLAYLVRRLLENGANSSFVNRIADPAIPPEDLVADPVDLACAIDPPGAPHPDIVAPAAILGERPNSRGLDLASEPELRALATDLAAAPLPEISSAAADGRAGEGDPPLVVRNPANLGDVLATIQPASPGTIDAAIAAAVTAAPAWAATPARDRVACLDRAADLFEAEQAHLMALAMREAGKTAANALSEVREAVDFLRYYAREALALAGTTPIGALACISPWNFPLAIFTGQVAAALAAGNAVLAKPAEQTPLMAARAVALLHRAGVPVDCLRLVTGEGKVGAVLVADPRISGVVFTGSTAAARSIQKSLATRLGPDGHPIPLIAETGGQNAMIVDSSALTEQVVLDVLASAFDSAGQRCSALRLLCLQEDCADKTLAMLKGAMAELRVGDPAVLATDIGPVIDADAQARIDGHVHEMRRRGYRTTSLKLPPACADGTFSAPAIIELNAVADLGEEVFGPVLHVVRYRRADLPNIIAAINTLGYGLTFGLHTRIDTTIAAVTDQIDVGNIYINRNQIGAVVGVQPFGGHGLSGTGPKAGGPLYLRRLVCDPPPIPTPGSALPLPLEALIAWLGTQDDAGLVADLRALGEVTPLGIDRLLPGPVGETNRYRTRPRGCILLCPETETGFWRQLGAVLATGDRAIVEPAIAGDLALDILPADMRARIDIAEAGPGGVDHVLIEGDSATIRATLEEVAAWSGPVILVQALRDGRYDLDLLVKEVSISTNTAAAGGNASLMSLV
jgi:RHH-type proline utilization regulon transcriptional repressor/proline dehydrogenase/delta 1-pyrroline-5-carboxylate dehydrogenase